MKKVNTCHRFACMYMNAHLDAMFLTEFTRE